MSSMIKRLITTLFAVLLLSLTCTSTSVPLSRRPFYNLILPVQTSQSCVNRIQTPMPTLGSLSCILIQATPTLALALAWPSEDLQRFAPTLFLTIETSSLRDTKIMFRQLQRASTISGRRFPVSQKYSYLATAWARL